MTMALTSSIPPFFKIDTITYNSALMAGGLIGTVGIVDILSKPILAKLGNHEETVRNGVALGIGVALVSLPACMQEMLGEADCSAIHLGIITSLGIAHRYCNHSPAKMYVNATFLGALLTAGFAAMSPD